MCSFCGECTESIVHLLCECAQIKELWGKVADLIHNIDPICKLEINPLNIIFDKIADCKTTHVANFICLITKQYIYAQRCLGNAVSFQVLRTKFYQLKGVEKYIALKNEKMSIFNKKWFVSVKEDCINTSFNVREYIEEYMSNKC